MTTDAVARMRSRISATAWVAAAVIALSTALTGLPDDHQAAVGVVVATTVGLVTWLVGARRSTPLPVTALMLVTGGCGAALVWLQPSGPGFVLAFMAMTALGLRAPRRNAVIAGALIVVVTGTAEGLASDQRISGVLEIVLGAGFLLLASAYAAASNEAHGQSLELLRQAEAARLAREESAVLAERGRLARELHDVLAHSLSGLALQLEGARLLAERTGADPRLTEQVTQAGRLAREGLTGAKRAVSTLRGEALPGPDDIPSLVDNACNTGVLASYAVVGSPRALAGETGLAVYRCVQEALTNATKYAGAGARVNVVLTWGDDDVRVEIADSGGTSAATGLTSGGFGLAGLAERAALAGGSLDAGPTGTGWQVRLTMPLRPPSPTSPTATSPTAATTPSKNPLASR